jgi:hypothetical protein
MIVRDRFGNLIAVGPAVNVDRESALAESKRLREFYGAEVEIDASQIVNARTALRQSELSYS